MIKESLAFRVVLASFLFLALPLLIASFLLFKSAYEDDVNNFAANLHEAASYRAETVMQLQTVSSVLLDEVGFLLDFEGMVTSGNYVELNRRLKEVAKIRSDLDFFMVGLEKEGRLQVVASSADSKGDLGYLSAVEFGKLNTNKSELITYWPFLNTENIKSGTPPYLFFMEPIYSAKTKQPIAYLLVIARIAEKLPTLLKESYDYDQQIRFAYLQEDGIVIASSDGRLDGQYFFDMSEAKRSQIVRENAELGGIPISPKPVVIVCREGANYFEFGFEDKLQIGYIYTIPESNAYILAYSPKGVIFATSVRHFFFFYTIFGVIVVLGAAITYKLTNLMNRPLKSLFSLMNKMQGGDFKERFQEQPLGFEINFLGRGFNEMIQSLIENIRQEEDYRVAKETYEKELEMGQQVQRQLLPTSLPAIEGIELSARYLFCPEVGGDFYDVSYRNGKLQLLVADAAGRGIYSCLFALGLRSEIRACASLEQDVGKILAKANNLFCRDTGESGMFVTALMGSYDLKTRILHYYSSGHTPGYVRRKDGTLVTLEHRGMAMGLVEAAYYETDQIQLFEGDLVFFYTDGLIETFNDRGQQYGDSRVKNSLQQRRWLTAAEVVEGFAREIAQFHGSDSFESEITLLAMKINGN